MGKSLEVSMTPDHVGASNSPTTTPPDFTQLAKAFHENAIQCPQILEDTATSLGVSVIALTKLGVGYYPADECTTWPERNAKGKVTAILRRSSDNAKRVMESGHRGLYFDPTDFPTKGKTKQRNEFVRVEKAGVSCPICGKNSGCLVSDDDIDDPSCVLCAHESKGSVEERETGFLHHRRKQNEFTSNPVTPIIVTEGASDAATAMDMVGYRTIGKPSANGGLDELTKLVKDCDVILVGDRDANQVGQLGLENTFNRLRPVVRSIVKILPPEGKGKDLREWRPTVQEFSRHVEENSTKGKTVKDVEENAPLRLVGNWLRDKYTSARGQRTLHSVYDNWYEWDSRYVSLATKSLEDRLYHDFDKKLVATHRGRRTDLDNLVCDDRVIKKLMHALERECFVPVGPDTHEPFLIKTGTSMDLTRAIIFRNGVYKPDTDSLAPLMPDTFVTSTLPYDFDRKAKCPIFRDASDQIFNNDDQSLDLLQEWYGYNLIASNHMQSMMFFFGVPGSGKSTLAGVLHNLLGSDRCCGASTDNFKTLFGKESLLNKYAAIMAESRDTKRDDIDKLLQTWKAITGGDILSVARKYRQAVDARLFCRLTYVANDVIPFDDASHAMAERSNLLYFANNYRKLGPDRMLDVKLRAEIPGIALWAIEGLKRLLARDKFTRPAASEEHLDDATAISDPLGVFLSECTETDPTLWAYTEHLFDLWQAWSKRTNHFVSGMNDTKFGKQLKQHIPTSYKKREMTKGNRQHKYYGVGILPGVMEHYCLPMTYNMQTQGGNTNV
jgi:P4 family phage/plasmid primase-like protien